MYNKKNITMINFLLKIPYYISKVFDKLKLEKHSRSFSNFNEAKKYCDCGYEFQRVVSFCYITIIILQDVYENGLKTHSPKLRKSNVGRTKRR
jgi:hypothetical protein